jgi:ligand-binding SRPBCC domain-containing protein
MDNRTMRTIQLTTLIQSPRERCFDLARSIDLHILSTARTGEAAVGGVTSGLIGPGQEVTWRARHLGLWQELTSRITAYERPSHFRDSMVRSAFKRFHHDHHFEMEGDATRMRDLFSFEAPLGLLGRLAERLFLERYLRRLLKERALVIKRVAESEEWRAYLADR